MDRSRLLISILACIGILPAAARAQSVLHVAGDVDATIEYLDLSDVPGSGVPVSSAGNMLVGDSHGTSIEIEVVDGQLKVRSLVGSLSAGALGGKSFTYGFLDPEFAALEITTFAGLTGRVLLPYKRIEDVEGVRIQWSGITVSGGTIIDVVYELSLYGESGSVLDVDRSLIAGDLGSFVNTLDGAVLRISDGRAGTWAYDTDPSFTVVPGPSTATIAMGSLVVAARRRRSR